MVENKLLSELKELEPAREKFAQLEAESKKIEIRIRDLRNEMSKSPSFKLTQELGSLENGKRAFDESLEHHRSEYEQLVKQKLPSLRTEAYNYITFTLNGDKEVMSAKKLMLKAFSEFIKAHDNLESLTEDKWGAACKQVEELRIDSYFEEVGQFYTTPVLMANPHTLPMVQMNKLKQEFEELTK